MRNISFENNNKENNTSYYEVVFHRVIEPYLFQKIVHVMMNVEVQKYEPLTTLII